MKCLLCKKGVMKKKKDFMEQDGIEFESLQCSNYGEEIMTMKQLKLLAKKYSKPL